MLETARGFSTDLRNGDLPFPELPARIGSLPVVRERIAEVWALAPTNVEDVFVRYREILAPFGTRVILLLSTVGFDLLKLTVSIILAGFLPVPGQRLAK